LANESAAKARSGVWGGNNQDLQGCDGVSGSVNGPRDSVAWIEPAMKGEISGNEDLCIDGTVESLRASNSGANFAEEESSALPQK
jgi:hypothetical protein